MKDPKRPELLPRVHGGGTSREDLVDQKLTARTALAQAQQDLRAAIPHARDYPGAPYSYNAARELHRERMTFLGDLWAELECEAFAIQNQ